MIDLHAQLIRHLSYPAWLLKNHRLSLLRYMKEFEAFQFKSKEEIERAQWGSLKRLITHAYDSSPFYRGRFEEIGLTPHDILSFDDYQALPLLRKEDLQDHVAELVSSRCPSSSLVPDMTGGSTGKPIRFYHDFERTISMEASSLRHDRWAGYCVGDRLASIWGHHRDLYDDGSIKERIKRFLLSRSIVLDSTTMTDEKMGDFVANLRHFRPKVIVAYARALALFAKYCADAGITDIHPHGIITTAELLLPEDRDLIEHVFNCKVFNRYGCREVSVIATECDFHSGLHINADTLYVEIVDDSGKSVPPGTPGKVVITDLLNYGMPFLRYSIEDVAVKADRECPCGRGLPLLETLEGRTTDFLVTPDGTKVSGPSMTIYLLTTVPGIRQAQIVQDSVDHIIFRIVQDGSFHDKGAGVLADKVKLYFGDAMRYNIEFVDRILPEQSGKYRFSISMTKA